MLLSSGYADIFPGVPVIAALLSLPDGATLQVWTIQAGRFRENRTVASLRGFHCIRLYSLGASEDFSLLIQSEVCKRDLFSITRHDGGSDINTMLSGGSLKVLIASVERIGKDFLRGHITFLKVIERRQQSSGIMGIGRLDLDIGQQRTLVVLFPGGIGLDNLYLVSLPFVGIAVKLVSVQKGLTC